ncbi:hypothetical protein [Shewanella canadensis]|nr:hypothetical protein [Shewanella canadensis]
MQLINKTERVTSWVDMIYFSACLLVSVIVLFDAWELVLTLLAQGLR